MFETWSGGALTGRVGDAIRNNQGWEFNRPNLDSLIASQDDFGGKELNQLFPTGDWMGQLLFRSLLRANIAAASVQPLVMASRSHLGPDAHS